MRLIHLPAQRLGERLLAVVQFTADAEIEGAPGANLDAVVRGDHGDWARHDFP